MRRIVPAILLITLLVIGGGIIANTAYQAGLSTAVTTAAANGATVVAPVPAYGYGYGYGWHPFGFGFGIFGFIAAIVACYRGMNCELGPVGVGRAVNQAVVQTFMLVFAANYVITTLYFVIVPPKI